MTDYSKILKEILEGIKNKDFAVFCGAGISLNSGLPLANTLKRDTLEKLTEDKGDIEEIMDSKLPFEAFIEVLAENSNISKILDIFKKGEPNANHIFIAKLAKAGLIKTIATTNFDLLIETALKKEGLIRGKDFEVYYNERQFSEIDFDELNKSNKICVFKLHGSIEDEKSIRTTMKAVASKLLSEKRENVIRYIFSNKSNKSHKSVLVLGYSCSDIFDINPQIQSTENSKSKIFFIEHSKEPSQNGYIKNSKLNDEKENPFKNFDEYMIKHVTDRLVEDIWNHLIKENKPENNKKKTEWQNFVDERSNNLREDIKYSICGLIFHTIADFKKAIEYYEKTLKIAKEIGDKAGESKCYGNLGNAYRDLGDFKKAIEYYEKSLKIKKEIGDKAGESICYTNLGIAYSNLGDFKKAIEYFEKAIPIFIETSQSHYLKIVYKNLSIAYEKMKNFEKSEEYKRKSEEI